MPAELSLRGFLKEVAAADGLVTVNEPVSPDLELTEVLWELEDAGRVDTVWFGNVENLHGTVADMPVVANLFADRQSCALALDSTVEEVGLEYHEREKQTQQVPPTTVPRNDAPVADRTKVKDDVDLRELPIITHHKKDAAPYITAGVCVVPSPPEKDWGYNAGTIRMEYRGPDDLGLFMIPGRHTASYFEEYEKQGLNMPIAVVLGHHPTFHFGSQTLHAIDVNEYGVVGGLRESALRVVESTTWGEDVLIPADAEVVIEGEVVADERIAEGPFGEYAGYYGDRSDDRHRIDVKAINRREDAIYHDIFAGHPDHLNLGGIPIEGRIFESVKETISSVKNVYLPPSGNCRQHCYVQIEKKKPGQGKNAILAALAPYDLVKHVVVVDEDVDLFDDRDVIWAIATRSQWDEDLIVEGGFSSITLDPSAEDYRITDRGGIDATKDWDQEFPERLARADVAVENAIDTVERATELPYEYN